jgi:hypothetical protein
MLQVARGKTPNPSLKRDAAKARRPLALRWAYGKPTPTLRLYCFDHRASCVSGNLSRRTGKDFDAQTDSYSGRHCYTVHICAAVLSPDGIRQPKLAQLRACFCCLHQCERSICGRSGHWHSSALGASHKKAQPGVQAGLAQKRASPLTLR